MSPRRWYGAVRDWVDGDIATFSRRWPSLTVVILPAIFIYAFTQSGAIHALIIALGGAWTAFFCWRLFSVDRGGPR